MDGSGYFSSAGRTYVMIATSLGGSVRHSKRFGIRQLMDVGCSLLGGSNWRTRVVTPNRCFSLVCDIWCARFAGSSSSRLVVLGWSSFSWWLELATVLLHPRILGNISADLQNQTRFCFSSVDESSVFI